jgi:hypothetical protein
MAWRVIESAVPRAGACIRAVYFVAGINTRAS